jgi:hypothetical protein
MKYILAAILVLLVATSAFGQNKITALHYDISIPDGDLKNYISDTSWRGIGFDGRWFVSPDRPIALGISLGWQVFDEHTNQTFATENAALTGKQGRYVNSFPMMVTGHYYFGNKDRMWVFAGVGVGTYYTIQRFEVGVFALEEDNWHFGFYPELGVQIPVEQMEGDIFISGRYNYALGSGDTVSGKSWDYTYWGINVGFAYNGW